MNCNTFEATMTSNSWAPLFRNLEYTLEAKISWTRMQISCWKREWDLGFLTASCCFFRHLWTTSLGNIIPLTCVHVSAAITGPLPIWGHVVEWHVSVMDFCSTWRTQQNKFPCLPLNSIPCLSQHSMLLQLFSPWNCTMRLQPQTRLIAQ